MYRSLALAALIAAPSLAFATIDSTLTPVYNDAGQYTASVSTRNQTWQLSPIDDEPRIVTASELCPRTDLPPKGLWVLSFDAEGQPQLVAPSATLLPDGHSGRVALRACDDPELQASTVDAYGVPAPVLEWLVAQSGAVMVNE